MATSWDTEALYSVSTPIFYHKVENNEMKSGIISVAKSKFLIGSFSEMSCAKIENGQKSTF